MYNVLKEEDAKPQKLFESWVEIKFDRYTANCHNLLQTHAEHV